MNEKRLVLISIFSKYRVWNFPEKYVEKLNQEFQDFEFIQTKKKSEFLELIPKAEILATFRFSAQDFKLAENLKWIHIAGAGFGKIFFNDLTNSKVIITKSAGINAETVAEMAWAFILSLAKMLPTWIEYKRNGNILDERIDFFNTETLFGKTLGIIGLGNIGRKIAKIGKAFDMKVIGTRKNFTKPVENVDEIFPPDKIYEVLNRSDYLVIAVPITPATDRMIGEKEFEAMKDRIKIINISRGKIIKEELLIENLKSGKIAAAGLDVLENEPISTDNELYKLPNVILTPHIAGYHDQYWDRLYQIFRTNIKHYQNKEPLLNQVNKEFKY